MWASSLLDTTNIIAGCSEKIKNADFTNPKCYNTLLTDDIIAAAAKSYTLKDFTENVQFMKPNWLNRVDLRVFWSAHPDFANIFKDCSIKDADGLYDSQCWDMSTLAYAQTSYFVTIVIVQWADLLISKTRFMSLATQGLRNTMLNIGLVFETVLAAIMCYTPFNIALGSRPLQWEHFGFNALPFFFYILIYDEIRK